MPRTSVVIPTWNGIELLVETLDSLREQRFDDFEIVVVDNGSTDGTVARIRRDHPDVVVVAFPENRGFAAAVNAGIRRAEGDVVALLNNDAVARPGWLEALVGTLDRDAEVGSVASRMLVYDDPSRIDAAGDTFGLFAWSRGHGQPDGPAYAESTDVLSACAGAAAYRREALEDVADDGAPFDERYFAYLEDVDLGIRLRLAGWRCVYQPEAVVLHHGSATAGRVPERKLYLLLRNSLFLAAQYLPAPRLLMAAPLLAVWPFYRAAREGHGPGVAGRVLIDFLRELPGTLRRRAALRRRRISMKEYRGALDPLFARHPGAEGAA